jgi:hypothetical protein
MPNINRPSLKHKTNFKTKDGDRWLAFDNDAQINQMIEAFMVINSKHLGQNHPEELQQGLL